MAQEIVPINEIGETLSDMLRTEFNTQDQQQFLTNFQLYLVHGSDYTSFVVDLDKVYKWMGFSTKGNAKSSLQKYFVKDSDFIIQNLLMPRDKQNHGGHNKEQILMSIETFKSLCMIANTDKGKQTRKYYCKMEGIFFQYIETSHKNSISMIENDAKKNIEYQRQQVLLASFQDVPCVYIVKVEERDDGSIILKLGETDNIRDRLISLRMEFKGCVLLDVFPCNRPHKFEQYLLHRHDIKAQRIIPTELINIDKEFTYERLTNIITKNIGNFDKVSAKERELRVEELKTKERVTLLTLISNTEDGDFRERLMKVLENVSEVQQPGVEVIKVSEESNEQPIDEKKTTMSHRRVYKYDPVNLNTPVATYYSLREAARSLDKDDIHDYHIRNACQTNTTVSEYRWFMTDDNETLPDTIPPTEQIKLISNKRKGLVAQISADKTRILNVTKNINTAAEVGKLSAGRVSEAIKKKEKAGGYYWEMYNECCDELKATYTDALPQETKETTCSKGVQRIDPVTHDVLQTYTNIQEVCSSFNTCHKTIHKYSQSGDIYKGFMWNIIE